MKHWIVALAALAAVPLVQPQVMAVNIPLAQMGVPHGDLWGPLPFDVKQELRRLLDAGPEELEGLLTSADPREVGLGLFVLEQNQDLDRLITLVDLLEDQRSTVPYAAPTATNHVFVPVEQTVGEYLAYIYAMWFGILPEEALARKEEIRNLGDPWARPYPWRIRLQRAEHPERLVADTIQERDQRVAAVKSEIAALPSDIRWTIIADRFGSGVYSLDEARTALLALDQSVRDQIMTGDPLTQHAGQIGWDLEKDLSAKARELLVGE